jgi:hypothetical protein
MAAQRNFNGVGKRRSIFSSEGISRWKWPKDLAWTGAAYDAGRRRIGRKGRRVSKPKVLQGDRRG